MTHRANLNILLAYHGKAQYVLPQVGLPESYCDFYPHYKIAAEFMAV